MQEENYKKDINIDELIEENKRLKEEIKKYSTQLYLFNEITQAMLTSIRLDEMAYIILTALTAHHGLGFNRAFLFVTDRFKNTIKGFMGIGPWDINEAQQIWENIKRHELNLYDLISVYHIIKNSPHKSRIQEVIESIELPLTKESGILFDTFFDRGPLHVNEKNFSIYENDPIVKILNLKEFLSVSLWTKEKPLGIIIVDNFVTKKPISEEDIRLVSLYLNQVAYALDNSIVFEETLIKSHTDPLTGLWNYGYFHYKFDEIYTQAQKENKIFSLILCDLDDFKKINDSFGHIEGDKLLKIVADILRVNTRRNDIVARYGGEEFAIICPNTNLDEAFYLAENIRKTLEEQRFHNQTITISIGVSSFDNISKSKEDIIHAADMALYKAKKEGKNRIVKG